MDPPPWNATAQRARWLVYHGTWATVTTLSTRQETSGKAWGNVRSLADGVGKNSSGLPCLYLPTPDPTAVDVSKDPRVVLSLTEAALPERLSDKGVCGGMDAEDPTCARIHLVGKLVALTTNASIAQAKADLGARHPLAPWLAAGGAHTGGAYLRLAFEEIQFLDYYGGLARLSVKEYLAADAPGAAA